MVPCDDSVTPVITPDGTGYATASIDAKKAFDYSGNTWTFYNKRFGRDSLDGAGLPLVSTVRFCPERHRLAPARTPTRSGTPAPRWCTAQGIQWPRTSTATS